MVPPFDWENWAGKTTHTHKGGSKPATRHGVAWRGLRLRSRCGHAWVSDGVQKISKVIYGNVLTPSKQTNWPTAKATAARATAAYEKYSSYLNVQSLQNNKTTI